MTEYAALVHAIQQSAARIQSQFAVDEPSLPQVYMAHLVLDGKEFLLSLTPTDLRDAGQQEKQQAGDGDLWASTPTQNREKQQEGEG